jgi:hypothetical protein
MTPANTATAAVNFMVALDVACCDVAVMVCFTGQPACRHSFKIHSDFVK